MRRNLLAAVLLTVAFALVPAAALADGGATMSSSQADQIAGQYYTNPRAFDGGTLTDFMDLNMASVPNSEGVQVLQAVLTIGESWTDGQGGWGGGPTCFPNPNYDATMPPGSLSFSPDRSTLDGVFYCEGFWPITGEWAQFSVLAHLDLWQTGHPFYRGVSKCDLWNPGSTMCQTRLTQAPATLVGDVTYNGTNFAAPGGVSALTALHWDTQVVTTP